MRTCIICRKKLAKNCLLRMVKTVSGNLEFDKNQNKLGRGASVCDDQMCIDKLKIKGKRFLEHFIKTKISDDRFDQLLLSLANRNLNS